MVMGSGLAEDADAPVDDVASMLFGGWDGKEDGGVHAG